MKTRKSIYANIRNIEQLRKERESLVWHTKGLEKQFRDSVSGANSFWGKDNLNSNDKPGLSGWIGLAVPVLLATFTLVRQINRSANRDRRRR